DGLRAGLPWWAPARSARHCGGTHRRPRAAPRASRCASLEGVLGGGVAAVPDRLHVVRHTAAGFLRQRGEGAEELRPEALVQPEHVGQDEDLSVHLWPRTDADRG